MRSIAVSLFVALGVGIALSTKCSRLSPFSENTAFTLSRRPLTDWRHRIIHRLEEQRYNTQAPLIGVLTQPHLPDDSRNDGDSEDGHGRHHEREQTISGPLVSWINSAGGRVVPIPFNAPWEEIKNIFEKINGLVLPGGSGRLEPGHPFFDTAEVLMKMAIERNKEGDVFPVFGICLGFETMHIILANTTREELLDPSAGQESVANTIIPTRAAHRSLFFYRWSESLMEDAQRPEFKPTFNAHEWAISPSAYDTFPELGEQLNILSKTRDADGVEYVSTVEHRLYPIFGTQYHPEKVSYEFSDETIPHTRTAIEIAFSIAELFVDVARLNSQNVDYNEQVHAVIDNYDRKFLAADNDQGSSDDPLPDTLWFIPEPRSKRPDPERPFDGWGQDLLRGGAASS